MTNSGVSEQATTSNSQPGSTLSTLSPASMTNSGVSEQATTSNSQPGSTPSTLSPASMTSSDTSEQPTTSNSHSGSTPSTLSPASMTSSGTSEQPTSSPISSSSTEMTALPGGTTTPGISEESTTSHTRPSLTSTVVSTESLQTLVPGTALSISSTVGFFSGPVHDSSFSITKSPFLKNPPSTLLGPTDSPVSGFDTTSSEFMCCSLVPTHL
ncbi:hypothetical protein P7K49_004133 [Saguinus oedipus]|uniref:Uncharacterized protein n=1 Tax=Saguinus oedipus TaxID=9490 RepID=A0ABQ9WA11_SAGOE|nr:hypothetical protein P7K49_004133 [Saguinus oedipus]